MSRNVWLLAFSSLLLAGVAYLVRVDYSSKLETDVSSLLPSAETEKTRIIRRIISEEQGRSVYISLNGLPEDAEAVEREFLDALRKSPLIESVDPVGANANLSALGFVNENRIGFLFPRWLADKRVQYAFEGASEERFSDWAANRAIQDLDLFLESPAAIELARPELMDPLLLSIGTLERLAENELGGPGLEGAGSEEALRGLYWAILAQSPLEPEAQDALKAELNQLESSLKKRLPALSLQYGGLVKLAGASRERIQRDVFKINLLSILGVVAVLSFLITRPWRLLWALPTLAAGGIGALSISFLVFEQVNVIVLVIGSILIGTSIDYAIHLIFEGESSESFPTRRLVSYACLSTVVGFMILLFAGLPLIRQIGVFVGSGLLSAYLMGKISIPPRSHERDHGLRSAISFKAAGAVWVALAAFLGLLGGYGLFGVDWRDDLRNLEAPDAALIEEDISLKEKFGSKDAGSLFMTTGESFLDVLQYEEDMVRRVEERGKAAGFFGLSLFLPQRSQVDGLRSIQEELPQLFDALRRALEEAGYDLEMFKTFFDEASSFEEASSISDEYYEELIAAFAAALGGPMKGFIGESNGAYWSMSAYAAQVSEAPEIAALSERTALFSQLVFLNRMLDEHRTALARFGTIAMLFVAGAIALLSGARKGGLVVLYPSLAGALAIGLCSLVFGSLNMFHLVGCFLGGAIALDYALFAMEAYSRGVAVPRSVWVSAGTTTASFMALSFSAIPVVRGLGVMVALLAILTLLLLHASQPILRKALEN